MNRTRYALALALCLTTRCALGATLVLGGGSVAMAQRTSLVGEQAITAMLGMFLLAAVVALAGVMLGGVHMPQEARQPRRST